jgi:putative aldouronate transport system substrate-binding protein
MTKRLISLLLATICILSLCLSSCSTEKKEGEGEDGTEIAEDEVQRQNLALTLYAIVEESTTEEGLKEVEEKISNYCVAKYKTAIDLRFFTEAEYQAALNAQYDKFAAEAAEKLKAEQEAAAAERSEAAYKATLSADERIKYEQKKRQEAKKKAEEEQKLKEEQAALVEQGKDKAVIKDVQMDILFVPGMEEYYSWIDQGLLIDLNTYLDNERKKIKDYVFPSFMTAATVEGSVYGIPNNAAIASNETFLLVNTALANKYGLDVSTIHSIKDLEGTLAKVAAGEAGIAPLTGDFDPEGLVFYDGIDMGHTTCAFTGTQIGEQFSANTTNAALNPGSTASTAFVDYCALKADWRAKGYLGAGQNFFASVQKLTEEDKMEWEKKGYTAHLYRGADFSTEAALSGGLYGISSHCQYPDRAMEIVELLATDSTLRNLLAFGIEETHYIVDGENKNVIHVINDNYSMNFFRAGNTLLGYVPDTMDPDYVNKAKEKNLNSVINPFLGFRYDWSNSEDEKWVKAIAEWKAYIDPIYAQLSYGTANYMDLMTEAYQTLRNNSNGTFSGSYADWQTECAFRTNYKAYTEKIAKLQTELIIEPASAN